MTKRSAQAAEAVAEMDPPIVTPSDAGAEPEEKRPAALPFEPNEPTEIALRFVAEIDPQTGDPERYITGVPARDLSDEDLDELARRATKGTLSRGDKGFAGVRNQLVESLVGSGLYQPPKE